MIKTFAIIENGLVINVAVADDHWPFPEDISIEVPAGIIPQVGWSYSEVSGFTPPGGIVFNVLNCTRTEVEAKQYLADTDWYVIRKMETNIEIPQEISDNRAAARLAIYTIPVSVP